MRDKYLQLISGNRSNAKAGYEVKAKDDVAEILIFDVIDSWFGVNAEEIVRELNAMPEKDLIIRINSPGGVVTEGLAIFNALSRHKGHVICVIDVLAASIASVIALAANEIHIVDNGTFMIHNPWGVSVGEADDMRKYAENLDKFRDKLVAIYVEKTGHSESEISDLMNRETWFDAEETVEFGFADKVIKPSDSARAFFDLSVYANAPEILKVKARGPVPDDVQDDDVGPDEKVEDNPAARASAKVRLALEAGDVI